VKQRQRQPQSNKRILVACVGNIFLGDDGFGVEVAQHLTQISRQDYPATTIDIEDFGIRGLDLAYTLFDDYDTLILIDIVSRGGAPGTLYLLDIAPEEASKEEPQVAFNAHSMDPAKMLAFVNTYRKKPLRALLLGCEPTPTAVRSAEEEICMGLSPPVLRAIDETIKLLTQVLETEINGEKIK
jgi:hydrogenase maturation protease